MGLETGTYISDLVSTNPISTDPKSEGDDHLRFIKSTVKATFPNLSGAVTASHTELSYVDGVTSAIQTQIDTKALNASPALTGTPTAPTAAPGTNTTQLATTAFVIAEAFSGALPSQTGNSGKVVTTDGTTASWGTDLKDDLIRFVDGTDTTKKLAFELGGFTTGTTRTVTVPNATFDMVGHNTTQTLTNKTITIADNAFTMQDNADATKQLVHELSGIGTGTTKTWTAVNENVTIFTPGWRYLSTVTASSSATVDIETTLDSTYENYMLVVNDMTIQSVNDDIYVLFKIGGAYVTTSTYNTMTVVNGLATNNLLFTQGYVMDAVTLSTSEGIDFVVHIPNPAEATRKKKIIISGSQSARCVFHAGIENTGTGAMTGIRFKMASGNIVTGTFRLYGLRNS